MTSFVFVFLFPVMLYFCSTIDSSAVDTWQQDFRRCRILKQFSRGEVIISADEKMVELDVHWSDGTDLDKVGAADISVRIDNAPLPHLKSLRSEGGMLNGFELGSVDSVLPLLSWRRPAARGHKARHSSVAAITFNLLT